MRRSAIFVLGALASLSPGCGGCGGTATLKKITSAAELIGGRDATGRIGDYLFANGAVRFIVQDAGSATGWGVYGGSLVDLSREESLGDDRFGEIFYQCDLRGFEPAKAEIVDDGSSDGPAVLRVSGHDRGIPYLDAVVPTEPLQVGIEVDYVLAKNETTMEIILRVHDEKKMGSREIGCGLVLLRGDSLDSFFGGAGRDGDRAIGEPEFIGGAGADAATSWVLYRKEGTMQSLAPQADVAVLSAAVRPFLANQTIEERFYLSVGRGDLESALEGMYKVHQPSPAELRLIGATVALPAIAEEYASQIVLTVFDASKPETSAFVTSVKPALGGFVLPPGSYRVDVELGALQLGHTMLEVTPGAATDAIELPIDAAQNLGVLQIDAKETDANGALIRATPVRARIGNRIESYFAAGEKIPLEPGEYTIVASLGPEHEMDTKTVTITGGQLTTVAPELKRVVDTTGWIAADFHVHSTRSVDATPSRRIRVLGAVAEGLDILTTTDHDTVSDFSGVARDLGLDGVLRTVSGIEMSMLYGHMNGFPIAAKSPETYFYPNWILYDAAGKFERMIEPVEVTAALRAAGAEIVQINHPRDGQGVFNYIKLDPATGEGMREWPNPDTCEILNGKRLEFWSDILKDVQGLIAHGKRITVTGTSDSHGDLGVGYARTLIKSASDDPASLDMPAIWRALREGRAIASNGPFIRFTAPNADIGDTISAAPGEPITFSVRVEAPSWIDAGRLVVYENDAIKMSVDIPDTDAVVRLEQTFTATTAGDAYYVVMVQGHEGVENPSPHKNESRTITNPIYVDRDGNGFSLR